MTLMPKTFDFFASFERVAEVTKTAAEELLKLFEPGADRTVLVARLKELEHDADGITHETLERLNRTFITPLDREDIHVLITSLDDVLDLVYACGARLMIYQLKTVPSYLPELARLLNEAVLEVSKAVHRLRDAKSRVRVLDHCVEINRIENASDDKLREALQRMFTEEKDPIELIKIKETVEILEDATDKCEDVANVIEGIVLKHA